MSPAYAAHVTMIDAATKQPVHVLVFDDLRVGDTQAYACSICGCVTPWLTSGPAPKACARACRDARLVFVGKYRDGLVGVAPGWVMPASFAWRPTLSADDVVRLIAALGALTASLQQHIAETDGAPDDDDQRELAAIDELQARLSELRGESTT